MAPLRLALLLALVGCAAPSDLDRYTQVSVQALDVDAAASEAVALIEDADESLHISLPAGEQTALTDAIATAWSDGLTVEVVTDWDQREDAGIVDLIDAGVPVTLADDGITYFEFNLNAEVTFDSEQTVLSSSFVVADRARFLSANDLGRAGAKGSFVLTGQGEDLCDDLLKEHNQLYGGADAVSRTAFDNTAKSIADPRWLYFLDGPSIELWFGPQERVTKRIIDAVYNAKSSVRVLTNEMANEGLTKALQDKAALGFEVEVVVGSGFGETSSALARQFATTTPDVRKRQTDTPNPTIVLIDLDVARDGNVYPAMGFMLSHDLYSATRLYRGSPVWNDQLIDGVLWVLEDSNHRGADRPEDRAPQLQALVELYDEHEARAGGL